MIKHAAHNLALALTLLALTLPAGGVFAQSATTTPTPSGVAGTNPEPQGVAGTNPEPQGVAGTNPEPQSTMEVIMLEILQ
jgi:hypothetical protein